MCMYNSYKVYSAASLLTCKSSAQILFRLIFTAMHTLFILQNDIIIT